MSTLQLNRIDVLLGLSDEELAYALNLLSEPFAISLSMKQVREIKKVLQSDKPNVLLALKKDIFFEKSFNECQFYKDESKDYSFVLEKPGVLDTDFFHLDFTKKASNRNVKDTDYPLTIRNVRKSDTIIIKNYVVKVNRLFIDWKMPLKLRKKWPVIVNKDGQNIYIPRYQKDFVIDSGCNFYVK